MAASATQPTSYLSDPNATAAYQTALGGAADLYSQYGGSNAPTYGTEQATQWANTVPGLLAAQTPYQVNAAQQMGNMQGYMNQFTNPALGYATSSAVPINQYQVGQSQINQYMSPYLNNVMNSAVANINETNAQQQQQMLGNAISKGAFGGDRAGIAQAALARQQNLSNNATLANILNTGYGQALGEANQQQGVQYGAQIANNQMLNAAANLMSNLGTQGQTAQLQQLQAQYNMGAAQQAQDQNAKNIAYQQYQNYMQQPYQQAKYLADMASGAASALGGTTVASIPQPSTVSQIAGGLGALAGQDFSGISNLFKNRGGSVRGHYNSGGRTGYADGGTPTAGQRLSDAYNAYTQAARAGADLPTLKSLYNDYITVKNGTGPGGANIGASDLGNQIRGYQYPTAASLEAANSSSAGGLASIAGLLAKLLAPQKQQKGGGGGGAPQIPKSEAKPANVAPAKPVDLSYNNPTRPTNATQQYLGPLGNTAEANQYLQTNTIPGVNMANVLKDNPLFNAPLALEAATPHTLPAYAGGSAMAGQNLSMSPTNPYGFAMALGKDGQPVASMNPRADQNMAISPAALNRAEAAAMDTRDLPATTNLPPSAAAGIGGISGGVNNFGFAGPQGVAPINNLVDKTQQDQAKAMDQRDLSAAEIAATSPVQATGVGGQLSGLSDLSNAQAIQAASQMGLQGLSPDQLQAAGFTADQAAAIAASNMMPTTDQAAAAPSSGGVSQLAQDVMASPEAAQGVSAVSNAPAQAVSAGSQEMWNNSYDMALGNGLSDLQAVNYADQQAASTNQTDTTQPTYTNSNGQQVDALGNLIQQPVIPTTSATMSSDQQPVIPTTSATVSPDSNYVYQDQSAVAPSVDTSGGTPTIANSADLTSPSANDVSYNDTNFQSYTPPAPIDTGPSYVGPTYNPNDTYNNFVAPDYSYTPDTSYYSPPAPVDYGSSSYYSNDFSPIFDYGGFDYNRGGGVHEHRHHRAYGGSNVRTPPVAPTFGVAPIAMNYGMPSSGYLQNQAENVAGAGVVPVSQGMQALAARDFLGGQGMNRGGVVNHHRR